MKRYEIRGVMVGVECDVCWGEGSLDAQTPVDPGFTRDTHYTRSTCLHCLGTGIRSKCIPLAEFELMLDRDLLAEPGGDG